MVKDLLASAGDLIDTGLIPGLGRCPRGGIGNPTGTPVFLPEKSHGQRNLAGYSPWGQKELDTSEHAYAHMCTYTVIKGQSQSKLLLLSRFSRVRLCATPETAAHQAPPSLGFSRQEHWSGLPFPSPMHESEK